MSEQRPKRDKDALDARTHVCVPSCHWPNGHWARGISAEHAEAEKATAKRIGEFLESLKEPSP